MQAIHTRARGAPARAIVGIVIGASAIPGCGSGDPYGYDGASRGHGATSAGSGAAGTAAGPSSVNSGGGLGGLPCDVQALVNNVCGSCHGSPPAGGAPMSLATYTDWTRQKGNGLTYAEIALARMQDTTAPMPPKPATAATQTQIDAVRAFITAGYPSIGCIDGGAGNTGGAPTTITSVCTSSTYWPSPDTTQEGLMQPGRACIACHQSQTGEPKLDFGGTVYPTMREPDRCYGVNGLSVMGTVVIRDANGTVHVAGINANGNFFAKADSGARPPFTAEVVSGGRTKAMAGQVPTGDCNSCHTEQGAMGAPGRITLP